MEFLNIQFKTACNKYEKNIETNFVKVTSTLSQALWNGMYLRWIVDPGPQREAELRAQVFCHFRDQLLIAIL